MLLLRVTAFGGCYGVAVLWWSLGVVGGSVGDGIGSALRPQVSMLL